MPVTIGQPVERRMDTEMHNLMPGTLVTHPMFPQWGKGVITAILYDTQSSKAIAKVMWETPLLSHAALHTLSHLQPFDAPKLD